MTYGHYVCIGNSEDLGRGLTCMTCWICGEHHFDQSPYELTIADKIYDKLKGITHGVVDFRQKLLPSRG